MEEQIKTQMNKAFWDLVDEKIAKDLDVVWLIRLYAELPKRLHDGYVQENHFKLKLQKHMM